MGNQSAIEKAVLDPSNEEVVQGVFKELDTDGSNALSRDEFSKFVKKLVAMYGRDEDDTEALANSSKVEKAAEKAVGKAKKHDVDGTIDAHAAEAKLLVKDLKGSSKKGEDGLTDEDRFIEKLFKEADTDNNGTVDFKEFSKFIHTRAELVKAAGPSVCYLTLVDFLEHMEFPLNPLRVCFPVLKLFLPFRNLSRFFLRRSFSTSFLRLFLPFRNLLRFFSSVFPILNFRGLISFLAIRNLRKPIPLHGEEDPFAQTQLLKHDRRFRNN
jgi:Ca2+-binding EF-hand superfamily protein